MTTKIGHGETLCLWEREEEDGEKRGRGGGLGEEGNKRRMGKIAV